MEFDEDQIRRLLRNMKHRSRFFQLVKQELKAAGRWKQLPRGKPRKGGGKPWIQREIDRP
jgi:hypothetical protein